jgi:hypothetical protein
MSVQLRSWAFRAAGAWTLVLILCAPAVAGFSGPQGLAARHAAPVLTGSGFGAQLQLESSEGRDAIEGDVHALLDHPFARVSAALADPGQWCEIMILHLNTKHCRRTGEGAGTELALRVGRKVEQSMKHATPLTFAWRAVATRPDYLALEMVAAEGPYDTRDYRLLVEAVPLPDGRTFLHMGYSFVYGSGSRLAMRLYLSTIGRDKVGFTVVQPGPEPEYVGGMRGVVERNTMRYYLAIDAYLASLDAPLQQQVERRFEAWFDATQRYPRQLHEIERADYLRMKRSEYLRQTAER